MADLIDRAAAIEVAKRHRSKMQLNEPLWHEGQDWASDRIADAIAALPAQGVNAATREAVLREAILWVKEAMVIVAPDGVPQRMALDSYRKQFSAIIEHLIQKDAAALAATEAGGVEAQPRKEVMPNDENSIDARSATSPGVTAGAVDALVKAAEKRGVRMALRAGLSVVANAPPNTSERDITLSVFQSIRALIGDKT